MATLKATRVLVDSIEGGEEGAPNMSPATCVLSDGTVLVGITVGHGANPETFKVWHLSGTGTTLGSYEYANAGWSGKDGGLVALPNKKALLVVQNIKYSLDPTPSNNVVITLDCAGANPVAEAVNASAYVQKFTSSNSHCRFGFYIESTGHVVLSGSNGVGVYKNGLATGFVATNQYCYGWWRHPTDPLKFAVQSYISTATPRATAREFTITSAGAISMADMVGAEVFNDNYWLFAAGNPYAAPAHFLNSSDPDYQNWDMRGADDAVVSEWNGPSSDYWQNYTGTMYPLGEKRFITTYEWAADSVPNSGEKFLPAVMEVDYSTTPPTHSEIVLSWASTIWPGVSLSYGSWTIDHANGLVCIAGNSNSSYGGNGFSSTVWLVEVEGGAPVEATTAISDVPVEIGLTSIVATVAGDLPEPKAFANLQFASANARMTLRTVIDNLRAAPIESILNEVPGKIVVDKGLPVPVRVMAIYPGERTETVGTTFDPKSGFGDDRDPGLIQTWRGLPRQAQLSVIASTVCTTNGTYAATGRQLPSEVNLGTEVRWLAEDYVSADQRWGATLGSQQPWSWDGIAEKITLQYRQAREVFSVPALSFDPAMMLASDFGTGEVMQMTISGAFVLRSALGYALLAAGEAAPDWFVRADARMVLGTWQKKVTAKSLLDLSVSTPYFITVVIRPPMTTVYISRGPGKTESMSVQNSYPEPVPLNFTVGKRQGEGALGNFELLELNVDTYARTKAQVEELNALYGSIYGSA